MIKKPIILGIEGTAWNLSVALVNPDDVILEVTETYSPKTGGIHPREAGQHHATYAAEVIERVFSKMDELGIPKEEIDGIAFSQGPGLGPCLRIVATAARMLSLVLKKPLIGVNHCVSHVEVGIWKTPAKDPIVLYASGANTQVLGYKDKKYRVFGETLDIGLGNALDKFARSANLSHPGGPKIEKLAKSAKNFIELPYTVKGMDFFFSGLSTAATRALFEQNDKNETKDKNEIKEKNETNDKNETKNKNEREIDEERLSDVCYSLQETSFAMAVEVTERALVHTGKNEVLLAGGVGANTRLREMLEIMCESRGAKFYVPEKRFMGDNGAMIAYTGLLMYLAKDTISIEESKVRADFRPDMVKVTWKNEEKEDIEKEIHKMRSGAEAIVSIGTEKINQHHNQHHKVIERKYVLKERISKNYRLPEIDEKLRKERTKTEASMISAARKVGISTPIIYDIYDFTIKMEYIDGIPLKYVIDSKKAEMLGKIIGKMHKNNIVHGDLTTSNMIWTEQNKNNNENKNKSESENSGKIYIIDFGLSHFDKQIEAKGVDIHVLFQTFESTHDSHKELTDSFKSGYISEYELAEDIIKRADEIKSRGRYI